MTKTISVNRVLSAMRCPKFRRRSVSEIRELLKRGIAAQAAAFDSSVAINMYGQSF